jgi:hypothetical protein
MNETETESVFLSEIYLVHMDLLCIYHIYELTKLKKSKKNHAYICAHE